MTAVFLVIALMVAGMALIAIEVLVIPGFGLIGVLGIASMVGSAYLAHVELGPTYAALAVVVGLVAGGAMFWLFPRTAAGKAMVLKTEVKGRAARPELRELDGREGVVVSDLRPSGAVEIDGRPVDVVTESGYVEAGTKVRVVRVEGARVVVEPLG